jgi:peptidyl-dipeptidase Dcp
MKKSLITLLCSGLALQASLAAEPAVTPSANPTTVNQNNQSSDNAYSDNPLFAVSTLQFEFPTFDKFKNEHFAPAFAEALRQHAAEIKAITDNSAEPSFDNTVVAMERAGQMLGRVARIFSNLTATNTNPTLEALSRDLAPKLSAHNDSIFLNAALFKRVKSVYATRASLNLDSESLRLLERYYTDFVRAGANLSDENQTKLKAYNSELASLSTKFNQNVLKESNASALIVNTKEELKGLSENEIKAAADAAKARGVEGKFLIPLLNTTGQPYLATLENRATRKALFEASAQRASHGGEFDNRDTIIRIAKLRAERALLLGYPNHATYSLEEGTAKTTTAVNNMLSGLAPAAVANAKKEAAEIQKIIDAQKGGFKVAAWDWAYYSEQVRKAKYNFDDSQLRPYFELDHVLIDGVFYAAHQLYGISFKERKDLPVYHPSVRVFEVFDTDGKSMAFFIADMYARDNKRGGAWMNSYVQQSDLFGQRPVLANHLNIKPPPAGEPTLLTLSEVKTAFHEFGHALHGLFSNVRYPRFSGTSVPRDFVEYPSQVNEMWMVWPEVLKNYAKHYKTGEAMPAGLLKKVESARKFNQGFATTEYIAASLLDQRWHQITPAQIPNDALAFEADALKQAGVDFAPVPPRYRSTYFSHIFGGGYSAGYYAYLWSEVLDADTVEWFKENGGLLRKNGDWFRQKLLSVGGSIEATEAFRTFRGRDAKIEPLLLRRGLTVQSK